MPLPDRMRAARCHRPQPGDAPLNVRVDEVAVPAPGPGEVLVEIHACGIGAADLQLARGTLGHGPVLPQTLGHEAAGVVAAVGEGVDGWMPGDRVAVHPARTCGVCPYCRAGRENLCPSLVVPGLDTDGSQADYAVVDQRQLVTLPGTVSFDRAAVLTDAVATPYHALKRGGVGPGVAVAVVGAGGLGLHAVQLARLAGAWVVAVDLDPVALERASDAGADEVVDSREPDAGGRVHALTGGGVDAAFEFAGSADTVATALAALKPGGRATIVGLSPDPLALASMSGFVSLETELVGAFLSTRADLEELVDLVDAGRLDLSVSVTHRFTIEQVPAALAALESREDHPVRMVVTR